MARFMIDYGIDLGTTNSAICRMENGVPVIKKSDVGADTLPSCVSFTKKMSIRVGQAAINDIEAAKRRSMREGSSQSTNAFIEFKRTMGTDQTYSSSFMNRSFTSEELSAEVLKTLKSLITDEVFRSVVVTVPAKFTVNQKDATIKAAELAGFGYCELLQEPIAAAMAYAVNSEHKNGNWMVFDFGGGTFDAALLKIEDGIMQVFDTEGDNYLGGKDLDYAIVDNIILPYLENNFDLSDSMSDPVKKTIIRDALKTYAEKAKNQLSFKTSEDILTNLGDLGEDDSGEELELDISITQADVFACMKPIFQKAVDICNKLLERNKLTGNQLDKVILVGGPTMSPLVREMLKDQVSPNVDTSIDPMTAVAKGAAIFASTRTAKLIDASNMDDKTIYLDMQYDASTVENELFIPVALDSKAMASNCPNSVHVELINKDRSWSSGKVEIDKQGNVIEVALKSSKTNIFTVKAFDITGNALNVFPSEISIIQGSMIGAAPLPYNIGIAIWDNIKERKVFISAKGMEKNKPLPTIGVCNNLKTTNILRAGSSEDVMTIPVYQVDEKPKDGMPADLYEYVADIVITGSELQKTIPFGSPVDITLKADASEMMTMEVYFPTEDITITKALDTSKRQDVNEADGQINQYITRLDEDIAEFTNLGISTEKLRNDFVFLKQECKNSSEKKAVLQHVKELMRRVNNIEDDTEILRAENKIKDELSRLSQANFIENIGTPESRKRLEDFRFQADQLLARRDYKLLNQLSEQVEQERIEITLIYQVIFCIQDSDNKFYDIEWTDPNRARSLIDRGLYFINNDQISMENLMPIAKELIDIYPKSSRVNINNLLSV